MLNYRVFEFNYLLNFGNINESFFCFAIVICFIAFLFYLTFKFILLK